jgi:hypothetical protein
MVRKNSRKESDYLSYQHTPNRQLEHPSGWCMTSDHDGCKYQFNHGKCGCTCHTLSKIQKTQIVKKEVVSIADSNDPRPWRKNE